MSELKLKVGQEYHTRDGNRAVVRFIMSSPAHSNHNHIGEVFSCGQWRARAWTQNGFTSSSISASDIVAEGTPPKYEESELLAGHEYRNPRTVLLNYYKDGAVVLVIGQSNDKDEVYQFATGTEELAMLAAEASKLRGELYQARELTASKGRALELMEAGRAADQIDTKNLIDWAETIICSAKPDPSPSVSSTDWDTSVHQWRNLKNQLYGS